jgi:NTP pyrophosphatase (non-canonical NTP hydrolase)
MDLNDYAAFTEDIWLTSKRDITTRDLTIMSLGLAGETGEVAEKIKKFFRDGTFNRDEFVKELGDVIYYWARICKYFDIDPNQVIDTNVHKLMDRKARGVMRGSGDNR